MTGNGQHLTPPPPPGGADDAAAFLGPTRLAYFSPTADQPVLADRKATFLLAATGLLVTVLLFFLHPLAALLRGPRPAVAWLLAVLLVTLAGLLLVAAKSAYAATVLMLPPMPRSLAFFRHVAAAPLEQYAADLRATDYAAALDAILHYNYSVATQAAGKFRLVRRALWCMRLAIPVWMGILLVLAVCR